MFLDYRNLSWEGKNHRTTFKKNRRRGREEEDEKVKLMAAAYLKMCKSTDRVALMMNFGKEEVEIYLLDEYVSYEERNAYYDIASCGIRDDYSNRFQIPKTIRIHEFESKITIENWCEMWFQRLVLKVLPKLLTAKQELWKFATRTRLTVDRLSESASPEMTREEQHKLILDFCNAYRQEVDANRKAALRDQLQQYVILQRQEEISKFLNLGTAIDEKPRVDAGPYDWDPWSRRRFRSFMFLEELRLVSTRTLGREFSPVESQLGHFEGSIMDERELMSCLAAVSTIMLPISLLFNERLTYPSV